jgi:hypothetical protein
MAKFVDNLSYEELLAENAKLKRKCEELKKQNEILEEKIINLKDIQSYEICKFFFNCRSLAETAKKFLYEDIVDCGDDIVYYNGCSVSIQSADDYKEYYFLKHGRNVDEDNEDE